jgi:hypothetical protein
MQMEIQMSKQSQRSIRLSLTQKNFDAANNTHFDVTNVKVAALDKIFKQHNFSTIHWTGNRHSDNFASAIGIVIDIDNGLTISAAESRLQHLKLNYALVTSRSHTPADHRFHILLPFNRTVHSLHDYDRIAKQIREKLFPECDPAVFDGARFIFGSPDEAYYSSNWAGVDYDVDNESKEINDAWSAELVMTTAKKLKVHAADILEKEPIYCPFHDDQKASAFVARSPKSNNMFIRCSTCDKTYWMKKETTSVADSCQHFWSLGSDIYQLGIVGEEFFLHAIGKDKLYSIVGANEKEEKEEVFNHLAREKHIPHLKRVNILGDMNTDKSYYTVSADKGIINVHYAAIPAKIQDNAFIETYLDRVFGKYKQFIKEWLAVFCYTNHTDLPTLILKGERGTGKNTFAEFVAEIFKPLSQMWHGMEKNFNPEAEMKLLIADETLTEDPDQYKTLKKLSGERYNMVNKKYQMPYEVLNNINIIILSNANTPVFVSREEKPTDERNNQFFVFDFVPFTGPIDTGLEEKLVDRLGYYIRTELKTVFDGLNMNGFRYSIHTPITPAELALFENNATEIEMEADRILEKLIEDTNNPHSIFEHRDFVKAGFVPKKYFYNQLLQNKNTNKVMRNLVERGYFMPYRGERHAIRNERERCYRMTSKLQERVKLDN